MCGLKAEQSGRSARVPAWTHLVLASLYPDRESLIVSPCLSRNVITSSAPCSHLFFRRTSV